MSFIFISSNKDLQKEFPEAIFINSSDSKWLEELKNTSSKLLILTLEEDVKEEIKSHFPNREIFDFEEYEKVIPPLKTLVREYSTPLQNYDLDYLKKMSKYEQKGLVEILKQEIKEKVKDQKNREITDEEIKNLNFDDVISYITVLKRTGERKDKIIFIAAKFGTLPIFKFFYPSYVEITRHYQPISMASSANNFPVMKYIIEEKKHNSNRGLNEALLFAKSKEMANYLISKGANILYAFNNAGRASKQNIELFKFYENELIQANQLFDYDIPYRNAIWFTNIPLANYLVDKVSNPRNAAWLNNRDAFDFFIERADEKKALNFFETNNIEIDTDLLDYAYKYKKNILAEFFLKKLQEQIS